MEKNGEQLRNDYTECLHIYCCVLEKAVLLPLYFKMYSESISYILKFQSEKVYLIHVSCTGTLLDSLGSAEIQRGCRTNRDVKV